MKKIAIMALMVSSMVNASWMDTDGTLNFACGDGLNNFEFKAYYNGQSPQLELAYDITVTQFPFLGAEILPFAQDVPGCQKAPITLSETATGAEVYFECAGDGDAGYGEIKANFATGEMNLDITFPEGQSTLYQPFEEDTNIKLPCDFLF